MKRSFFLIVLFFVPSIGWGQQQLIDSLYKQISLPGISPEQKVVALADLGNALRYQNINKAIYIGEQAVEIGRQLKDKQYAAYAWSQIYASYSKAKKKDMAVCAIDSALWFAGKSGNDAAMGRAYLNAANNAFVEDDKAAVEQSLKSLELLIPAKEWYGAVRACYFLAGTFSKTNNLEKNEKYARIALECANSSNDPNAVALAYLLAADYYELHYQLKKDALSKDSAMIYFQKTIDTYNTNEGIIKTRFIGGNVRLNYANFLYQYCPEIPKDSITNLLYQAIERAYEINDEPVASSCYGFLGELLGNEGQYVRAESMLLSSLKKFEDSKIPHYNSMCNLTAGLINLSERMGDKSRIIRYQKLYLEYYRKLFDTEQAQTISALEASFEQQKRDQELAVLQKESAFNRKINYFSSSIAVLSIVLLFLIFFSYHMKLKSEVQKKRLLEAENKDVQMQILLKEAEQKLIRQEKEQLQKEVFAGAVQLQQKNELLETVRKEIANVQAIPKLDKIIKENLQIDDYFEEYKSMIKDTHPNFYNQLQERASMKLTDLDLRYCTYIYFRIPSKQMASMLNVEYSTIRMNKHRLKQKLGLDKNEDLDRFIWSVQ